MSFLIVGFGLAFMNIDNMSFNGSLLFGACVGATGLVFGGIALVFSQICSGSRGAVGLSLAVLGIFYMMRAVGDIGTEALSFISPLGLVTRTEVFITDIVWPVLVLIAQAIILFIITMLINSKRDIEQGLLSARKGRSHASFLLGSTPGLIIKLLKSTIIAWAVTIYLLGAAYGSIFGDIESFINSSDIIRQMFTVDSTSDMNLQFVNTLMVVMTIIATVAVLMTILRLRSEEKKGQLDDILARHVSREKLMACYIGIALIFSIVLQFLTALGLWQAASMVMDDPMEFSEILKTAFIYVPAMFIFIGIASALIGVFPKGTIVVWLFLGYAFFIDYFGEILDLPDWTNNITPFGQTPRFPVESFEAAPVAIMCGISIIFIVFGFIGFRRRDIQ